MTISNLLPILDKLYTIDLNSCLCETHKQELREEDKWIVVCFNKEPCFRNEKGLIGFIHICTDETVVEVSEHLKHYTVYSIKALLNAFK